MELDTFCNDIVPDFTPLGGNRPDCAVVMAAAVSLVMDNHSQYASSSSLLPPDVVDTAMAVVCATVIIRSASEVVPLPHGSGRGDRLSCRLEIASDEALDEFRNDNIDSEQNRMPWRNFDTVMLQIVLPDSIASCGDYYLVNCQSLVSIDLRSTKVRTAGGRFMTLCDRLTTVHLPDTLHSVGVGFLSECVKLVSADLLNTMLHTAADRFMHGCDQLTALHLPDTIQSVGNRFLFQCSNLATIDLRNTMLHTVGSIFMYGCDKLTAVHLPDSLHTVGRNFLFCSSLVSIDLRNTNLHRAGDNFMSRSAKLTAVHLPDTLSTVGGSFLEDCPGLSREAVARMKLSIQARHAEAVSRDI